MKRTKVHTMRTNVFRDGKVHVLARQCDTCIFRRGNLMRLHPGRLREMIDGALEAETAIICHDTIHEVGRRENAVCRGFYDRHKNDVLPLQLTQLFGNTEFVEPPRA